jgi:hypothetical protein
VLPVGVTKFEKRKLVALKPGVLALAILFAITSIALV